MNAPPVPLTPLIGREAERATARRLLGQTEVRLLTLTGPPGIGKTRLALAIANDMRGDFADGVCLVELAPLADPDHVPAAIARALDVRDTAGRGLPEALCESLRERHVLLVLDNFEHLLGAAPTVTRLLSHCPQLKVLVTSRAALRLSGERELVVPPLAIPGPGLVPAPARLAQFEAVRLFVGRAQDVSPDFTLSAENAAATAELCTRLEGIPLAIELAAARIKVLTPQAIVARLTDRLSLLTIGVRDAPTRHRTLRGAIECSHDLLSPPEQALFRRLSIFTGGFTLAAAEGVFGHDVLADVTSLVEQSLVRREPAVPSDDGEPRYGMFETIREFAREGLEVSGEALALRRPYVRHYLALAERLAATIEPLVSWTTGARQIWQARPALLKLLREQDNLRQALAWSCADGRAPDGDGGEAALRLAAALWRLWHQYGDRSEGRRWLEEALTLPWAARATPTRAAACFGAGVLAASEAFRAAAHPHFTQSAAVCQVLGDTAGRARAMLALAELSTAGHGDWAASRPLFDEALALYRQLGDPLPLAQALRAVAFGRSVLGKEYHQADALYAESLDLCRSVGDRRALAWTLIGYGHLAREMGDADRSLTLHEESLALYRAMGDEVGEASALHHVAESLRLKGAYAQAAALYEESNALFRRFPNPQGMIARALQGLGYAALASGDVTRAATHFAESLELLQPAPGGPPFSTVDVCLAGLGGVAKRIGQPERAARLFGAADALADRRWGQLPAADRAIYGRDRDALRAELGEEVFDAAYAAGRRMPSDGAIDDALSLAASASTGEAPSRPPREGAVDALTPREREVARLIAQGLTNREIAAALVITNRTAATHVEHILAKLDVRSRTQIGAWAAEHGLLATAPRVLVNSAPSTLEPLR